MSKSEVDQIFDGVMAFSTAVHKADKRRNLVNEIAELKQPRCGHCSYWMKTSCKPEKQHGQFKSMDSWGCKGFERNHFTVQIIAKREAELVEI